MESIAVLASAPTADALEELAGIRVRRAELDARETVLLAALAVDPDPYGDGHGDLGKHWIREDVACTLRLPSAAAAGKLAFAEHLVARFSTTVAAMTAGRIGLRHAERLVEAAGHLPVDAIPTVEAAALEHVDAQTFAAFCRTLRRAVLAADPGGAEDRLARCRADRRVSFTPVDNGMTVVWALVPSEQAAALQARIQAIVDDWASDDRTVEQRRADALCELAGDVTVQVHVTVPATTLLGADDTTGELAGAGPVSASVARALAFDPTSRWRRILLDDRGQVCDVAARTYRPPAPLARLVRTRDRTCRFPGCRRRAECCDLDHVRPWSAGGPTSADNLIALCPRHHHLKHDAGWRVARHPDGSTAWTSPTGHTYLEPPPEAA